MDLSVSATEYITHRHLHTGLLPLWGDREVHAPVYFYICILLVYTPNLDGRALVEVILNGYPGHPALG